VIAFLGADSSSQTDEQKAYCAACRQAGLDECDTCDPSRIGKIDG